jgi:hypothetical protein
MSFGGGGGPTRPAGATAGGNGGFSSSSSPGAMGRSVPGVMMGFNSGVSPVRSQGSPLGRSYSPASHPRDGFSSSPGGGRGGVRE